MMGLLRRTICVLYKTHIELRLLNIVEEDNHSMFSIKFSKFMDGDFSDTSDTPMPQDIENSSRPFFNGHFISPASFAVFCPFYLMFDADMLIKGCGRSVLCVLPDLLSGERKLDALSRLVRPWLPLTFTSILEHQNSVFLLDFMDCGLAGGVKGRSLKLNGQMMHLPANNTVLFISSPYITSLEDLSAKGFALGDIPLHDAKREFILASENFALEHKIISQLEELTQRLQQTTKQVQDEKKKTDK